MGDQPLAERMGSRERYPLVLQQCGNCSLVQLSHIVDQHEVFPPDHPYTTGNTAALRRHFGDLGTSLSADLHEGDLVVDIGANDGTLLSAFRGDLRRIAVEPTRQIERCEPGITTYQEFFTARLAGEIYDKYGAAAVITATNVLAHVPSPHDFMAGVTTLLADDGVFITENHDLASIIDGLQVDTIYHEHLRYYSVASLSHLLWMHDLEVISSQRIAIHGGSFQVRAMKQADNLTWRAQSVMAQLHNLILEATPERIYGIGAATRAVPLMYYATITPYIEAVCEVSTSDKIGKYMPGTDIPVIDEARLVEDQPGYALLFPWHLADELAAKLRQTGYKGKFIVPLPVPRVID